MRRQLTTIALSLVAFLAFTTAATAQSPQEVLSRFNDEPTVLEVQSVAMLYAGVDPDQVDGWYTQASLANLMPETAEYRFRFRTDDRTTDRATTDQDPVTGADLNFEDRREIREYEQLQHDVKVSWDLSELVFNPDVLRVAREVGRIAKQREDIVTTVTKLYYERRQAQIDMVLNPPSSTSEKLRAELRIQELTANIDALTGGWFGQELKAAGKDPY